MKLKAHGIYGVVLEWIRRWLTDRKQRVILNGGTSDWLPVLSGVPQGSVLGPCLFLIYKNDIDLNISGEMLNFADDTKVICPIEKEENGATLHADLDKLLDWSNKWQMQFNLEKCKVMHFGYNNPCLEYTMGEAKLTVTKSEKDLDVVIDSTLKPAAHIVNCVKKANQMLGMIQRTITYKNKKILLLMYKSLVRPHLEYAVQTWSPHQIGHIRLIEGVQRRFTRMIPELKSLPYEARLKRLNLTTLEIRRIRGDLIEVYKILNGLEKINPDSMFTRFTYNTRCHTMKLEKKHVHLDSRKYVFTQRVIDYWNALPQTAIDAESINHFKDHLNVHLYNIIRGLNKPLAFSLSPTPH